MSFIIKNLFRWSWNILDGIYLKEAWEHGRESEVGVLYISPSGQEQLQNKKSYEKSDQKESWL